MPYLLWLDLHCCSLELTGLAVVEVGSAQGSTVSRPCWFKEEGEARRLQDAGGLVGPAQVQLPGLQTLTLTKSFSLLLLYFSPYEIKQIISLICLTGCLEGSNMAVAL